MAQPLRNIPKKRQASIPDVSTPVPPAAIADLVGADQPLTDADLQDIQEHGPQPARGKRPRAFRIIEYYIGPCAGP